MDTILNKLEVFLLIVISKYAVTHGLSYSNDEIASKYNAVATYVKHILLMSPIGVKSLKQIAKAISILAKYRVWLKDLKE